MDLHRASEYATVQILICARDFDFKVAKTSQTVGKARLVLAQPVVIRNTNIVDTGHEIILLFHQKLFQPFTARLFHSLEAKLFKIETTRNE